MLSGTQCHPQLTTTQQLAPTRLFDGIAAAGVKGERERRAGPPTPSKARVTMTSINTNSLELFRVRLLQFRSLLHKLSRERHKVPALLTPAANLLLAVLQREGARREESSVSVALLLTRPNSGVVAS